MRRRAMRSVGLWVVALVSILGLGLGAACASHEPGAAGQAESGGIAAAELVESGQRLRVVVRAPGRKIKAAGGGSRIEWLDREVGFHLGSKRFPDLTLLVQALRMRLKSGPAALEVEWGAGVAYGELVKAMDIAHQAGFSAFVFPVIEGKRTWPVQVSLVVDPEEVDEPVVLPALGRKLPLWRRPGPIPARIHLRQSGAVVYKKHIYYDSSGPGPDQTDLRRILGYFANKLMVKRKVAGFDRSVPDEPLVIRADEWTEMRHFEPITEVCGHPSVQIRKIQLAVRLKNWSKGPDQRRGTQDDISVVRGR